MKSGSKHRIQSFVVIMFAAIDAYAKITGPDPGYTHAPGDLGNCVACHDTYHEANVGPGSVRVEGGPINGVYQLGQQYTLTVTVQQAGRSRFGFQLTAIDSNGNRAGTLSAISSDAQINPETWLGRQYAEHTEIGTLATGSGNRTWQVRWTAPATDIGTVRFYIAGNAANNSGDNQGDYIYTNSAITDSTTSAVTVALQSQLTGLVLSPGSHYSINWTVTGTSNIDNIEARYSTDDGMTFPITNLLFSTTDAQTTSYDWTVPNTPTTQARIRITVGKKSGDAATPALSGRFTIGAGTGSAPPPVVSSATASGKKLYVFGENFQMGAVIEVDGVEKGTNNEEDFSHQLRSKKGAKKIDIGEAVTITVRNPDGQRSSPFGLTRPPE